MKKRESGITLLTLVITIIVMIILAGIALKSAIGENGIIGQTSNTINKYTNSSDQEQEGLNGFVDEFNEIINGGGTGDGGSGDEDITITDKPTISIADWNTTGGIVEISTKSEYTTQYRIGKTGQWKEYTGQVNVDNGDTIYARYSSDEGVSQTVGKIVEDTNGPEVTISNLTVDGDQITITVTAVDNEMGMPTPPTYNYYIKPHSETYYESVGHNTTGVYTFTNLQGNTSYDIRVSTTDIAGNQGVATTNSETGSTVEIPNLVPGSNIYFDLDPSGPTNGNVNVTIRVPGLEEPLYIEYSIDGTDNWTRYENPVEMTNNGRVYARVTDGTETSNVVYVDVTNIDREKPTLDGEITVTDTTSKSISISVPGVVDTEGAVATPQYTYYIRKTSGGSYTQDGEATTEQTHVFDDLDDNTSYDIKVTFKDNAGNVGEATITKSTVLVPTLNSSNTTFTLSNTKWTNKPITVTISTTVSGYTLQYSTNGSTYQKYTGPITVSSNLTVYARLWDERNSTENVGTATTKAITNIDTSLSDLGVIVKNEEPVDGDTVTKDKNDNPITIPDGFTPQKDPDSSDPYNPTVDDGVIVKDGSGNEFVWIPVGTINTDSGTKTINYNRYTYANWVNGGTDSDTNSMKIKTSSSSSEYFAESLNQSEKTSAETNKGFYLGRYEAGVSTGVRTENSGTSAKVEIQQGLDVYNYVTQSEARSLAENMATVEGYSGTTNLPSSYAWDTALKFLEQTGNTSYLTNSSQGNYYNTKYGGKSQTYASALIETGRTTAVKHLYDMGGNVYEWTTERYSNSEATKVSRGGFYGFLSTDEPVIGRFSSSNTKDQAVGFRVALFLGEVDSAPKYMDDLQVGDYVAYTPGSETASSYSLTAAESGYTSDQTISKPNSLSWRVLSINDDGTVDLISSSLASTNTFYFRGALGYNNGVYLLNDIADKLYSNSSLGATARSLTIEDIEKGMTDAGLEYVHSYSSSSSASITWGETKTYTSSSYRYYPNLYAQENGSGINTTTTKTDGIGQSDSYYTSPTTETYSQASTEGLTVTQTYYNRSMSSSYYKNSTFYSLIHGVSGDQWLASRFVAAYSTFANFGLRIVVDSILDGSTLFRSNYDSLSLYGYLRPVVSLKSNIRLGSGDGKSSSTAYQIIN